MKQGWILLLTAAILSACQPNPITPQPKDKIEDKTPVPVKAIKVSTFAGTGELGFKEGPKAEAQFYHPTGVGFDADQNLYIVDRFNQRIRKINGAGDVSTIIGTGARGNREGSIEQALLNQPITLLTQPNQVYIVDAPNHAIRLFENNTLSTFTGRGFEGFKEGSLKEAEFNWPSGMVKDSKGNFLVSDRRNHRIRKITPEGQVSTLAGLGLSGYNDGPPEKALFKEPMALTIDSQDNLYIADSQNHMIRKVTPDGVVSILAGHIENGQGVSGSRDDKNPLKAEFNAPSGIVVSKSGKLYVSDRFNHMIRVIETTGEVSTLAGGGDGYKDGEGSEAQFSFPFAVTLDKNEDLYIADFGNHAIRKITLPNP